MAPMGHARSPVTTSARSARAKNPSAFAKCVQMLERRSTKMVTTRMAPWCHRAAPQCDAARAVDRALTPMRRGIDETDDEFDASNNSAVRRADGSRLEGMVVWSNDT